MKDSIIQKKPTRVLVILNRKAGSANSDELERHIREAFDGFGVRTDIRMVQDGDIVEAVKAAVSDGVDAVVPAGGDGTVKIAVEQLAGSDVPIGIIPLGTINHLARNANIPLDIDGAIRTIAEGNIVTVDIGRVNGIPFTTDCVLGMFAHAMFAAEKQRGMGSANKSRRFLKLFSMLFRIFLRLPVSYYEVRADGEIIRSKTAFIAVSVDRMEVTLTKFGNREDLHAGRLYLYYPQATTRRELLKLVFLALIGNEDRARDLEIAAHRSMSVGVEKRKLLVAIDGEFRLLEPPLEFESVPGGIRLFVPAAEAEEVRAAAG